MEINVKLTDDPYIIHKDNFLDKRFKGHSGVYVMKDIANSYLYIGKTSNFYSRIRGHRSNSIFYREIEIVEMYTVFDEFYKDITETFLINEFKPIHNKGKTYYMQEDYMSMLQNIEEEESYLNSMIEDYKNDRYSTVGLDYMDDDYEIDIITYENKMDDLELAELEQRLERLKVRKFGIIMRKTL